MFRFVHTADLHLDSPLRSLALRDETLSDAVGNATRAALTRIVDLCLEERADALLIAGDLYDGGQTSMKTARFLVRELARLDAAGILTFVIRGNHDAEATITRELELPPSVTVFDGRARIHRLGPAAIQGISFRDRHVPESLLPRYRPPEPDAVNIALMHTSLGGAQGHDVYAPCALADLRAAGMDYWALGHVHARFAEPGPPAVVMPGIPQGRDIGEDGPKSATLVTVRDDRSLLIEERPTATLQFERVPVPLDGIADWAEALSAMRTALREARRQALAEAVVLRPVLTGASPLAWRLRRDADLLTAEAERIAEEIGSAWIDKLELRLSAEAEAGEGALADLARLVTPAGALPPHLLAEGEALADTLAAALPPELREGFGADESARADRVRALMQEGAAEVLAHLRARPEPS